MNEVLVSITNNSHSYLANAITWQEYKSRMVELMRDASEHDLQVLADLFTVNAMHLITRGH